MLLFEIVGLAIPMEFQWSHRQNRVIYLRDGTMATLQHISTIVVLYNKHSCVLFTKIYQQSI